MEMKQQNGAKMHLHESIQGAAMSQALFERKLRRSLKRRGNAKVKRRFSTGTEGLASSFDSRSENSKIFDFSFSLGDDKDFNSSRYLGSSVYKKSSPGPSPSPRRTKSTATSSSSLKHTVATKQYMLASTAAKNVSNQQRSHSFLGKSTSEGKTEAHEEKNTTSSLIRQSMESHISKDSSLHDATQAWNNGSDDIEHKVPSPTHSSAPPPSVAFGSHIVSPVPPKPVKVKQIDPSSNLLQPTIGNLIRLRICGIKPPASTQPPTSTTRDSDEPLLLSMSRDYNSDSEVSIRAGRKASMYRKRGDLNGSTVATESERLEMQEQERFSIWHPRYRVPKGIFGYSQPFIHRSGPSPSSSAEVDAKPHPPLFEKFVRRMRDGFEKMSPGGTMSRALRNLPPGWYPADYEEVEYVNHADVFKASSSSNNLSEQTMSKSFSGGGSVVLHSNGSTTISPQREGRRRSLGPHQSRRYRSADSFSRHPDEFQGFRKWHPEMFEEDSSGFFARGIWPVADRRPASAPTSPSLSSRKHQNNPLGEITATAPALSDSLKRQSYDSSWIEGDTPSYQESQYAEEEARGFINASSITGSVSVSNEEAQMNAYLQWLEDQRPNTQEGGEELDDEQQQQQQQQQQHQQQREDLQLNFPHPRQLALKADREEPPQISPWSR